MSVILGIDAAWTAKNASGVALVVQGRRGWRCEALAASYQEFLKSAYGSGMTPESGSTIEGPPIPALLRSCNIITGGKPVTLIAVDMPVATTEIRGRRVADNSISEFFGKAKCATHSPTPARPGRQSELLRDRCFSEGFKLATSDTRPKSLNHLIEVYPHPALLTLLEETERIPYKVTKTKTYWPDDSLDSRKGKVLGEMTRIRDALARSISGIDLTLPERAGGVESIASLKPFEDRLDALVCAWLGIKFLKGQIKPYGDRTAAIWVPAGRD